MRGDEPIHAVPGPAGGGWATRRGARGGGRRRRVFSITDAGRKALAAWLHDPTGELPEIRDVGLLKLFFADLAGPEQVSALARTQQQAHQDRLDQYKSINALHPPGGAGATVRLGLAYERAAVAFWASTAEQPRT